MATLGYVQVAADSTGKRLRTTIVEDASTVHQEIMNLAGSTGDLIEPFSSVPSSSAFAYGVRTIMGATGTVMGSVALLGGSTANQIGAVLISTALNSAAIDPRIIAPGSTIDVRVIGAASSGILGTVLSATGLGASAIDPRQVTVVGGTSGAYISVLNATAQGAAAIDSRQATIVAATSGAVLWTVGAGSSGVTGTSLISTGLTGAAIDPRIIAAQATSVVLGTVAVQQSTAYISVIRGFADSTANYNQKYFYTTGIVAAAAATMQSLNVVTNLTSGTSGTSFNVAASKIFRIQHIEASIRCTSGATLFADFAIRAVTTTGGATGTNPPVWYHRLVSQSPSSAALNGGEDFAVSGLEIDLPSSASFGVSITSNSTASQECTFAFGGKEYNL